MTAAPKGGAAPRREPLQCLDIARAVLGEPLRQSGQQSSFNCPHHEDSHPSLKINPRKNVWLCGPCGASGNAWKLAAFLSGHSPDDKPAVSSWLKERGLLNGAKRSKKDRNPVATYTYTDADGIPVARKLRFEPGRNGQKKEFSWQRLENNAWVDGLAGVKTPLYRYHEIKNEEVVAYVEGEKAADAGVKLGLPTTTAGGVNGFRPDHAEALRGKDVVIFQDNDRPGREHAQRVAAALYGIARFIRTVALPGLPEKGDLYDFIESGGTFDTLASLVDNTALWKPQPVEGSTILDSVFLFVKRFVSLSESQARVVALWVIHAHVFSSADATPYLAITSAEKQSGKTRLLEVLETLVADPWFTGRVTAAVLTRKIDAEQPTLLLDESDAAFGGEKEYAEALRGVLNTGHRKGGKSSCCVGQGADVTFRDFSTFCPKAIAGIGKLPDTVADRAIPIRLKRAASGERIERFRLRDVEVETTSLRRQIEAFCLQVKAELPGARPELPQELSDRQQDGAEPLLAIADAVGGEWPQAARQALVELCAHVQDDDGSIGVLLLADIRQILAARGVDRLPSSELASALAEIETSPWGEWSHGKAISPARVARLLRPFGIAPHTIRIVDKTQKGYEGEDFRDAFARYLRVDTDPLTHPPLQSVTPSQANTGAGSSDFSNRNTNRHTGESATRPPAGGEVANGGGGQLNADALEV